MWGTNYFQPWEIAILDSPLIQRLRYIHQVGLAYLIFPTAVHTRFDHTLGVATVVDRIVDSINRKSKDEIIGTQEQYSLRLSAILHDCGHGPFSHASEEVYKNTDEFKEIIKYINKKFEITPKPHEILSYLIVNSEYFKKWFDERIVKTELIDSRLSTLLKINKIAEYIIGYSSDSNTKFLADIINGPMDADKLDYIARDAKFSGLSIGYDLDRYFKTIDIHKVDVRSKVFTRLGVPISGVNSLEQMIMSKMTLYTSMYHHHKVRCVENMFSNFCTLCMKGEIKKSANIHLNHPVDFLNYTDADLIKFSCYEGVYKKNANLLNYFISRRILMKRALVISRPFIKGLEENKSMKIRFEKLISDCRYNQEELKKKIVKIANKYLKSIYEKNPDINHLNINHIIIDVPKPLTMEESLGTTVPIDTSVLGETEEVEIDEIFPIKRWAEGYNAIKWRGHIFCYSEYQEAVNRASRALLAKPPYNIIFSSTATILCKLKHEWLTEERDLKIV